jgi:septum formation protein
VKAAGLILASRSPRRLQLLREAGYMFRVCEADVREDLISHFTPGELTLYHAASKARAVARKHPDDVVLGADTLVALDGKPLGKPASMEEAFRMVSSLSGRVHEVYTGVWIEYLEEARSTGFVECSRVHFHKLNPDQIRDYLSRINPMDKAGAYAAQEEGKRIIARVEGLFSNVVGLPVERLAPVLGIYGIQPEPSSPPHRTSRRIRR